MADNLGPNGLVVSAGKCAGPIPAENCANAQKMPSGHKQSHYMGMLYFPHEVRFFAAIEAAHFPDPQIDALQQSREGAPFMGTALAG